jgi:hypothetical protein
MLVSQRMFMVSWCEGAFVLEEKNSAQSPWVCAHFAG